MRTVKVVIIGNSGVEPPWLGAHDQLDGLRIILIITRVCLRPLLDSIPYNHWNRFYHHDTHHPRPDDSATLQIRIRPCHYHVSSLFYLRRSRDRRIPLGKNASRPSSEGRAVSEEAALESINELVPPLGSPSSSLATSEDLGDWTPMYVFNHVSSAEVVIHDNGTRTSFLLMKPTPAFISMRTPMPVLTGKTQRDLYSSSTHALDPLAHHPKRSSKRRSRTLQLSPAPKVFPELLGCLLLRKTLGPIRRRQSVLDVWHASGSTVI
jgi:hypothetical protein